MFDNNIHNTLYTHTLFQKLSLREFLLIHKGGELQNIHSKEPLLNRKQAAEYLNVTVGTLAVWDCTKRYNLEPIKVGRAVRYRRSSLDQFINEKDKAPFKIKERRVLRKPFSR